MANLLRKICLASVISMSLLTGQILLTSYAEQLEILHTNDVHGRLLPFKLGVSDYDKDIGGIARRFALVQQIKARDKLAEMLILDSGDIAQGTPLYTLYKGIPDVQYMNRMGYDAATVGNHEFDKGPEILLGMIKEARFPFLAANLKFNRKSPLYGKLKPYTIKELKNIKVGIIGLVTDEVRLVTNIERDTEILDPIKIAKKYIKQIDKDTDVIILLNHLGNKYDAYLAKNIKNADIIVGGHSHTVYQEPLIVKDAAGEDVIIVQTGDSGKYLGDLKVDVKNDRVRLLSYKLIPVDAKITPNNEIQVELKSFQDHIDKYATTVVGSCATNINLIRDEVRSKETSGGNLVADSIKNRFKDIDIAIHNGGALRSDKILPPGNITLLDLIELNPFEDDVILYELKGKDIKSTLERSVAYLPYSFGGFLQVSGLSFVVDVSKKSQSLTRDYLNIKDEGDRVKDIYVNGKPLDPAKTYLVASNAFLANGGNGYWAIRDNSRNVNNTGISINSIIEDYLKNHSPVSPRIEDRIQVINTPGTKEE